MHAIVSQGSILRRLFFPIYMNKLPDGLNSNVKIFPDDIFIFSVFNDLKFSSDTLNSDLLKINEWVSIETYT